jgi:hypothetical protein
MDGDNMLMRQFAQTPNLLQHLRRRKEMRRTANLDLRAQVDATYRASQNYLIGGVIPTLDVTTRGSADNFHGHTFILRVRNMLPLTNSSHKIPPLRMKELSIEGDIVPRRRQTQSIHVLFGDREIIVIARFVDERKDAIGDSNCIEDQEETACFEQDPFHVCLAG